VALANTFQAGRTAKPDLVSVSATVNPFGNRVIYTFDQAPPAVVTPGDFHLYDAAGTQFTAGGAGTVDTAANTVTFTNAFTDSQVNAAVSAGVQDMSVNPAFGAPLNTEDFPEGSASVPK